MNLLNISHSYKPCGTKVSYPFGMQKVRVKDLGAVMKKAAFEALQEPVKVSRKLKKVA